MNLETETISKYCHIPFKVGVQMEVESGAFLLNTLCM